MIGLKSQDFRFNLLIWIGCLCLVTSCKQEQKANYPPISITTPPPVKSHRSPHSVQMQSWKMIQSGVEWQSRNVGTGGMIALVRVDPTQVRLRVAYNPQAPKKLSEWVNKFHPLIAINGGYFEANYQASALSIADGVVSGQSYQGFGGMLVVDSKGKIELRSLVNRSNPLNKDWVQAIQCFPRLVWGGLAVPIQDDGQRARRTALAIDNTGRLLLIVSDKPIWTLSEFGRWLVAANLGIVRALNLDGGPSTGLILRIPSSTILVDSETVLPQILMIERR